MKRLIPALAIMASLLSASTAAAEDRKPNVLFIAIDDLRPELGCYGDTVVKSPNIDRFASQATLFNRAYCQVPVCGASRASLMTGILPTKIRFMNHKTMADKDTPGATTMPQVFREAGYVTKANGKIFHTASDTADRSWSRGVFNPGMSHLEALDPATEKAKGDKRALFYESVEAPDNAYGDGVVAEQTIKDLRELKDSGEPFFLACGFIRPHLPFFAPKKYWDLYDEASIPLADNRYRPKGAPKALGRGSGELNTYALGDFKRGTDAFHRKMRHGYFASTSYADKLTGDVLRELERLGLAENTIVIIWGDHGWHLGEHTFWGKHNTLHNAIRVPLIVRIPGQSTGARSDSLIQNVDIFPTLCSLAGLKTPGSAQGKSFESVLTDPNAEINDSAYSRFKEADAVVTERFTYSRFENGEEMLFDRQKDPQENRNVAANPKYAPALERMRKKLGEHMKLAKAASF